MFSGDKLLGGPQAGIIAGRADLVAACTSHPLARALRPGGLVLAALQDTALAYLARRGQDIPLWRLATRSVDGLWNRAEALGAGTVVETVAVTGGGTLPGTEIPSVGVALEGDRRAGLRAVAVPVIARVVEDRTVLDLRTVDPDQDPLVAAAVTALTGGG
jgi:L-seryl-tRNA(Ser) seleniumtransferase